ncbi:oligosaccharide flippase family protein [Salinisphaera aquimarina]|uniref:Oligosaccharide flippase family protein n=1 Tax=Salinisphaera aquimarina TaxID=2094031 RepID=A0ABV7EQP2_9GAMM
MLSWISSSSLDAAGRIGLKVLSTILFARWLTPEIFGQASLTIVIVSVLAVLVTAPFEESLTQRKVVNSRHFASALTVVTGLSTLVFLLAIGVNHGATFASADTARVAALVGWFSLMLFAQGPISIYTALARRHRGFKRIAWSNLAGEVVGTTVGLILAVSGVGVWSLLAVRIVGRFVTLAGLMATCPVVIRPGLSATHIRQLSTFAGWFFAGRCVGTLSDAVFQGLVARYFGLAGAGYLNMALRVIEPVRGATGSMGHNISMSFFMRVQDAPDRLRDSVEQAMASTSLILLPLFVGLAAVGPTIINVLAGPKWSVSGPVITALAFAAATTAATNFQASAFAAKGRADLCLWAVCVEFLLMIAALVLLSPLGILAVGLARLASNIGEAGYVMVMARRVLDVEVKRTFIVVGPIMLSACAMGLCVAAVGRAPWLDSSALLRLVVQIGCGVVIYTLLAGLFHRAGLRSAYGKLRGKPVAEKLS